MSVLIADEEHLHRQRRHVAALAGMSAAFQELIDIEKTYDTED